MNREGQEKRAKRGKWDESGRRVLMRLPLLKSFKERDTMMKLKDRKIVKKRFNFSLVVFEDISFAEGVLPNRVHLFQFN